MNAAPGRRLVSIGILAHQEEHGIRATLDSLLGQDVFSRFAVEVVVVANGCTDRTVEVSCDVLHARRDELDAVSARVEDLEAPGKANAWNEYVHRVSSRDAEFLVLMDADIRFLNPSSISALIEALDRAPRAVVAVGRAVKDIELKATRGPFERLLCAATPRIDPDDVPLCGQLYCARARELRRFRLPREIQVEDGFIRALLLTERFTAPEDRRRIVFTPEAEHLFESVRTVGELFRHERWIVSGSIVNMLLFARFGAEATPQRGADELMTEWGAADPAWLSRHVAAQASRRSVDLLPRSWWTRRWSRWLALPTSKKVTRLPLVAAASSFDLLVFAAAIREVKGGGGYRYWGRAGRTAGGPAARAAHGS